MKTISVCFKKGNKEYYFSSNIDNLQVDDHVVVMTAGGKELAIVVNNDVQNCQISNSKLMPVFAKATQKDIDAHEFNIIKAQESYLIFREIVGQFPDLDMHIVDAQYNLDRSKLLFMYLSDDRVDFRELLKVLATRFKTRIELKQIGARDKAKLIGGLGPCGMQTCCTKFLKDFDNISINMAKNQMLSLNPVKISGLCGRLLCCLKYENDLYIEEKKHFPKLGSTVIYDEKKYRVSGANFLMNLVKIEGHGIIKMVLKEEIEWSK